MTTIAQTIGTNSSRDYAWLQDRIAAWTHRTDLGDEIPDFIMLAEKRINGDLEARMQNLTVSLTASANNEAVALPADLNSIRALSLDGHGALDYVTPKAFAEEFASAQYGQPEKYTIQGANLLLGPTPDIDYPMTLNYKGGVPALADSGGVNWLIQQHAEIYLAATMCEAWIYIGNDDKLGLWEGRYQNAIAKLNNTDWNVAGQLVVRSDTTTP